MNGESENPAQPIDFNLLISRIILIYVDTTGACSTLAHVDRNSCGICGQAIQVTWTSSNLCTS